jgi:CSLREA domain-containing protein
MTVMPNDKGTIMNRGMRVMLAAGVAAALLSTPAHAEPDVPEAPGAMEAPLAVMTTAAIDEPMLPLAVEAAVINVNTTNDELNGDGDCSLREAIEVANRDAAISGCTAGSGVNDIINVPAGNYVLSLPGGLRVTESAFIRGAGASGTVIDGGGPNNRTIFNIDGRQLYVCDSSDGQVLRYNAKGTYAGVFIGAGPNAPVLPNDILPGSYGAISQYVYVSGFSSGIKRYNRTTGAYVDTVSTAGSSGVFAPTSMTFGDPGNFDFNLYATNYQPTGGGNVPGVWRFNPETPTFTNYFVSTTYVPNTIVFGTGDDLFVSDPTNHLIKRYNGSTGAFISNFTSGMPLNRPRGILFRGAHLYVANELANNVLRFNATTGAYVDTFVAAGGPMTKPTQMAFGPDGDFYVLGRNAIGPAVFRYNGTTGAFIEEFVSPGEGPLGSASCIEWMDGIGSGPIVHISDMTMRNGAQGVFIDTNASAVLSRDVIADNSGGFGAGVTVDIGAFAQIFDTHIRDNSSFNFGGGVYNIGSTEIGNSTISGNFSPNAGGGIFNQAGNLTLFNTTVSGNSTNRAGGGLMNQGNAYINNSTIVLNSADSEASAGDYAGGGIFNNPGGNVFIRNSIVAQNTDYPAGPSEAPDCNGEIKSYRNNVIGNNKNCDFKDYSLPGAPFDQAGTAVSPINPRIDPLGNYGGPTPTHRLQAGSPAEDAGSTVQDNSDPVSACREQDQRGYSRALGGRCDAGAFERVTYTVQLPIVVR